MLGAQKKPALNEYGQRRNGRKRRNGYIAALPVLDCIASSTLAKAILRR